MRDPLRQVVAPDEFHHQERSDLTLPAFQTHPTFFEPIDRRDVRVIQRGEDLRFAPKSSESIGIRRHRCGEHLDRHLALQVRVGRPVDLAL